MLSVWFVGNPEVTAQVGRSGEHCCYRFLTEPANERKRQLFDRYDSFFELRISPQESDIRLDFAINKPLYRASIEIPARCHQRGTHDGLSICAYIVPVQQAIAEHFWPDSRSSHAKRKPHSIFAASWT